MQSPAAGVTDTGLLRRPNKGQTGGGGRGMATDASAEQDPSCQACLELAGLGISVLVPLGDLPRDPGKVASPCWASVVSSVKWDCKD